jgi:outer membrane protein TolC
VTGSVALQALQPLTPLYPLYEVYRIQGFAEDAARLTLAAAREQVRFRVAEAYFRLMAATRMAEVAQAAVETVEAHLKTARAFHEAGVVGRDDVLRAETALAKTRDGLSQAKAAVALCRAALNVLVGLPVNEPTVPSAQPADPPPEVRLSEEDCVQAALSKRGEVNAMHRRVEMADAGRQAAIGQMIPTVAALIRYNHQEGSKFMKADNWFVGAALSWNFWEWGATWYKVKSAASDGDKARSGVEAVRDGITLDVKKAYLDLRTSRSSIDFAKVAIASAEENLRVVTKKYEASTATSVEVLDAQTSLTQGRIQYQIALAAYYTALANLQRAIGQEL